MSNQYSGLETLIEQYCDDQKPHVFLHPFDYGLSYVSPGIRDYTEDEIQALSKRDFETRLFITAKVFEGDSVWVRTHFTDNHIHNTTFNVIRDCLKATHALKNFTAAKSSLAEMVTTCMETDKNQYYSFAITMASALSNMASNTSFEIHEDMVACKDDIELARMRLCLLMHIIFTKAEMSDFLRNEGSNIFRLVHAQTASSKRDKLFFFLPWFSFLLQLCLTGYVISQNISDGIAFLPGREEVDTNSFYQNLPLAIVTFVYSSIVAYPGIIEIKSSFKLYGHIGPIQVIDFIINSILPFVLLVSGFFVILNSDSFIESVLNTAALLFIPEIDDQLPALLGYEETAIYNNFLLTESLNEYDLLCSLDDSHITRSFVKGVNDVIGVQFSDYYLTYWPEQGATPEEGIHFKPHEVIKGKTLNGKQMGDLVCPTNFVTDRCLIRKLVWSYTTGYDYTIKPRIGYLRLEMLNGEVVEINMKENNTKIGVAESFFKLEGVFIITAFQMSSAILSLRLCGSYKAEDFLKAFEYYSLWGISSHGKKLLNKHQQYQNKQRNIKKYASWISKSDDIFEVNAM